MAVYVVFAVAVSVYFTAAPATVGAPTVAPLDPSDAVSAPSDAVTALGTAELRVVVIADSTPIVTSSSGAVETMLGHTRMLSAGTVTAIRRRVGSTMNVSAVAAAPPV